MGQGLVLHREGVSIVPSAGTSETSQGHIGLPHAKPIRSDQGFRGNYHPLSGRLRRETRLMGDSGKTRMMGGARKCSQGGFMNPKEEHMPRAGTIDRPTQRSTERMRMNADVQKAIEKVSMLIGHQCEIMALVMTLCGITAAGRIMGL